MPISRRPLTEREQEILETVRQQVMEIHSPRQRELLSKLDAANNDQARAEIRRAMDDNHTNIHVDTEELMFLAGQYNGFLAGIQYALADPQDARAKISALNTIDALTRTLDVLILKSERGGSENASDTVPR